MPRKEGEPEQQDEDNIEEEAQKNTSILGKRNHDSDIALSKKITEPRRAASQLYINDVIFVIDNGFWFPAQVVTELTDNRVKLLLIGHVPTKYVEHSAKLSDITTQSPCFNVMPQLQPYTQWNAEEIRKREAKQRAGQWELTQNSEDVYYALVSNIIKKHIDESNFPKKTFRIKLQIEQLSKQLLDRVRHRVNKDINYVGFSLQHWGPQEDQDGWAMFEIISVPLEEEILREWM